MIVFDSFNLIAGKQYVQKPRECERERDVLKYLFFQICYTCLGPSIHGLVTDILVNVNIGNTLSRRSFQN